MPRGKWTFAASDLLRSPIGLVTRGQGTSLSFTRNGVPECSFSLSHEDDECATIINALINSDTIPTLQGYRNSGSGNVLRFNGYLAGISEESGPNASTATFTFRGPFGRLLGEGADRGRFTLASFSYAATDAGAIAKNLVGFAATLASTSIDTTTGTIATTVNRDRTYPGGTNIGQAVIDLANIQNGYDFEVLPVMTGVDANGAPALGQFNVYSSQGQDRPAAKFEYGSETISNCIAMHRETQPPMNDVIVWGSNGQGTRVGVGPASYGLWQASYQRTDLTQQTTISDMANALTRGNPVKTIDFTPDPALAPAPWDDYWLGDTVHFYAREGALVQGPDSVRVNQITIVVDDNGYEVAALPDPRQNEIPPFGDPAESVSSAVQVEVT